MSELPTIDEIIENFELLDDWDDRYRYLIELGDALEPFPEEDKTRENKVQGCVSQVWVTSHIDEAAGQKRLVLAGDSDAHIVRGLIAIALALFSGRPVEEIVVRDEKQVFDQLGLSEHISPQRSNGLRSLVSRIKSDAQRHAA